MLINIFLRLSFIYLTYQKPPLFIIRLIISLVPIECTSDSRLILLEHCNYPRFGVHCNYPGNISQVVDMFEEIYMAISYPRDISFIYWL